MIYDEVIPPHKLTFYYKLFFYCVFIMGIVFHDVVDEIKCLFPVAIAETDNRIPVYFRLGFMEHEIIHVVIPDFWFFSV